MTSLLIVLAVLLQSGNASVGGFVQDPTQAYIPGVTVTATNTQTGVAATTVSNESGTYNISGLLPGTYRLTAELPGFKTQVFNEVQLGQGVAGRYNFTLQVGALSDSVEVTAEATALIAESSPTIGQVLGEEKVRDLPLVGNNVLSLMSTMAGAFCTLQAVADAKTGQILLQNPLPGKRGNIGRRTMENPGSWDFDANISKTFRITESKGLMVRVDATNIFNHPVPGNPSLNINSANAFGFIADKSNARRQFQGQLRFNF